MSYRDIRDLKRDNTTTPVAIREINTDQNYIRAEDAYGGIIQISMDFHGPIISIPQLGETWIASRYGNAWTLTRKLESGTEITRLQDLGPGDKRIEAPGDLYLNGQSVIVNGLNINNLIPTGTMMLFTGALEPTGYTLADGGELSRVGDSAALHILYASMGYPYGSGDGTTTFNKPDLRGRVAVGLAPTGHTDVRTLGLNEGSPLTSRRIAHSHSKGNISIAVSGAHAHTFTGTAATITGGTHGHGHTLSISGGSHGHTGSTSSDNSHSHGYDAPTFSSPQIGSVTDVDVTVATGTSHNQTDTLGSHSHSITADAATHTHSTGEFSGSIGGADGGHSHSYTPAGTLSGSDLHSHSNADFTGLVGTLTNAPSEGPAYITTNYIIKL